MTRPRLLIEEWLPIAEIGVESVRERTPMTPFPAPNRLHVWWARRPLVASRAAILASLLPADADRDKFLHMLGIHGDPVAAKVPDRRGQTAGMEFGSAKRRTATVGPSPIHRARGTRDGSRQKRQELGRYIGYDVPGPDGGRREHPFRGARLGLHTIANDLNPVAWLILKATVEFPAKYGQALLGGISNLASEFRPSDRENDSQPSIHPSRCRTASRRLPLGPHHHLPLLRRPGAAVAELAARQQGDGRPAGAAHRRPEHRHCTFEIVTKAKDHSPGTVKQGDGLCPYPDCGRVIDGDEVKTQAQAGKMGEQLYAVVYKQTVKTGTTKAGKDKLKSVRGFRAPRPEDDVSAQVEAALEAKRPEWEARNIFPTETIPDWLSSNYDPRTASTSMASSTGPTSSRPANFLAIARASKSSTNWSTRSAKQHGGEYPGSGQGGLGVSGDRHG